MSATWQVGVRWLTRALRSTSLAHPDSAKRLVKGRHHMNLFSHTHIWMTVRQHSRSLELYQILYYYVATAAMNGVSAPVSIGFSLELTALRLVSNRNVSVSARSICAMILESCICILLSCCPGEASE